jgi:drug/metabolite transporter (DMT)-like permease
VTEVGSRQPEAGTHLLLLLGQICFASLPVAGRMAMLGHIPPAGIVLVRVTGGALVFSLLAWRRGTLKIARADIPALIGCALLGVAANQELFIQGLARSTATNASVIGSTIPVFTALVAIVLRREPPRMRRLLGIAVACAGAALLVGADRLSTSSEHMAGNAMIIVNSLSYGAYLVVVRSLADRYDPIGLVAMLFITAIPMVAPLGIAAWADAPPLTTGDAGYLVFLVAVPTVGAYGLVQTALRRAEATLVAAYIYLQPVFATIGAIFLLGEEPSMRLVACGALVLAGVWLAARSRRTPCDRWRRNRRACRARDRPRSSRGRRSCIDPASARSSFRAGPRSPNRRSSDTCRSRRSSRPDRRCCRR